MLRAYYSRVCDQIPIDTTKLNPQFNIVNRSAILQDTARPHLYSAAKSQEVDCWLVTDFVTLGSPLTRPLFHGER